MTIILQVLFATLIVFLPTVINAESTVDIYGGSSNTGNTNVTITDYPFIGTTTTYNESINGNSPTLGLRYVHWIDEDNLFFDPDKDFSMLGFGADLYGFQADGEYTEATVIALSLNVLLRYPHDTWQPYIGIGWVLHGMNVNVNGQSSVGESVSGSGSGMGIDLRTGLHWFINENISLFSEYRFSSISYNEDSDNLIFGGETLSTRLSTQHILFGLSFAL